MGVSGITLCLLAQNGSNYFESNRVYFNNRVSRLLYRYDYNVSLIFLHHIVRTQFHTLFEAENTPMQISCAGGSFSERASLLTLFHRMYLGEWNQISR